MIRIASVVLIWVALASCVRVKIERTPPATPSTERPVEATGRVVEVGSDPTTWLALEPVSGGAQTRLDGSAATTLRALTGAIVWVSGRRSANAMRVDVYEVRRVGDQDVDDGVIVEMANGLGLRMRTGTVRAVPDATPALRAIVGARVWISRPVAGVTPSYGVIAPKP